MNGLRARMRRDADAGLTLIEMVVALGVIVVVLAAAGATFVTVLTAQRAAEGTDRAVQLANDQIEQSRKVPWASLGVYSGDAGYRSSVTYPGGPEDTVTLGATRPAGARSPLPQATVTRSNQFTVRTDITWALDPVTGAAPSNGSPGYAYKRVHVTVTWRQGQATKRFDDETLRAPTLAEQIPVAVASGPVNPCDQPAPFCRLWVTSGQVLANPGGGTSPTVAPVQFRAELRDPASTVTATTPTGTYALASANGGLSWAYQVGVGVNLPPGPAQVSFAATTAAGTFTRTYPAAAWRLPLAAPAEITPAVGGWTTGSLLVDPARASGDSSPFTGTEVSVAALCVDPTGRLYYTSALMFDTTNIDDMDGPHQPTAVYTGAAAGNSTDTVTAAVAPADISHPRAAAGPYTGSPDGVSGGYVGGSSTIRGTTNTLRWTAAIQQGTVLRAPATSITLSLLRPGDGVTVQATATVPVTTQSSGAYCGVIPPPPTLTAALPTPTATTVNLSWSAVSSAVSYTVYYAGTTQVVPGCDRVTATSCADTGKTRGRTYSYEVVAQNATGAVSPRSNTASATVIDTPGAVTALAPQIYSGRLAVTWPAVPSTPTNPVDGYRLYRNGTLLATLPPSATSYTDPGLTNGAPYSYRLAAFNAYAEGASASTITVSPARVGILVDIYAEWGGVPNFTYTWLYNLGFRDITYLTGATTQTQIAGYDVLVADSALWALSGGSVNARMTLLRNAYDAGARVMTVGNDNTAAEIPLITGTYQAGGLGSWGYNATGAPGLNPPFPAFTSGDGKQTDGGQYAVTGVRAGAVPVATWNYPGGYPTDITALAESNPNNGRWFHLRYLSPALAADPTNPAASIAANGLSWLTIGGARPGSTMPVGAVLRAGQSLYSPNLRYMFTLQTNGDLVMRVRDPAGNPGNVLWRTNTPNAGPGAYLIMQGDGNLVLYNNGVPLWDTGTGTAGPSAYFAVQDDGNMNVIAGGTIRWNQAILANGRTLSNGQWMYSYNTLYALTLQPDGNLVLYQRDAAGTIGPALWNTGTWNAGPNTRLVMQGDGNLVLYQGTTPLWSTLTGTTGPATWLIVQDDSNLVLYNNGRAVWAR